MANTKEPPFLVELIILLLGGIGFLVTLPCAACTLIVDYYRPYAPYWCAAFAVCLACALVLRNTEWGRRELQDDKKSQPQRRSPKLPKRATPLHTRTQNSTAQRSTRPPIR